MMVTIDTATIALVPATQSSAAPLGVAAVVTDASGAHPVGRLVRWSVSRAGATLYSGSGTTDASGRLSAFSQPGTGKVPGWGADAEGGPDQVCRGRHQGQCFQDVHVGRTGHHTVGQLADDAGGRRLGSLSVKVTDALGNVAGVPVTFTLPSGAPAAIFPGGSNTNPMTTVQVVTNALGVATAPTMTAKAVEGSFLLTMSAAGATNAVVTMAAQYRIGEFVSPVSPTTTTSATGTTPVKVSVLGVAGALLTDSQAAALLTAGRVQIRFHRIAPTVEPGWTAVSTSLIRYDPKKDFFQADLKASTVGWLKPNTYRVEFHSVNRQRADAGGRQLLRPRQPVLRRHGDEVAGPSAPLRCASIDAGPRSANVWPCG